MAINKSSGDQVASEGKINGLTLNDKNQLVKVTKDGKAVMSVKYSAKGNPVKITQGDISTEYHYDGLGRLTGVNDSNKGQANYVYQVDEEDIRLQFDDRTKGAISTQTKITGHNQTQAQLQYASVSGSPWQAVVWSPALSKFLVPSPEQIAAPDDGFQSSKQRRRLYDAKSTIKGHQINFDKPSNSFSKPAEYAVANCSTDGSGTELDCFLYGVILDAASTITVGSPYTFSALAIADDDCLVKAYTFSIDNVIRGYNLSGLFPYTFDQQGQHSVQVTAECSCGGYFKWDGMSVEAQCPNGAINTCYKLVTETVAMTPANRQRRKVGVGEQINISLSPATDDVVHWSLSGDGKLGSIVGPHAVLTAGDISSSPIVTAKIGSVTLSVQFEVIPPTGVLITKRPNTNLYHSWSNRSSVGFLGQVLVQPTDVSFYGANIREGGGVAVATGLYANANGTVHDIGSWAGILQNNYLEITDTIQSQAHLPPFIYSTFRWPIEMEYRVGAGGIKQFAIATHLEVSDESKACIDKSGSNQYCKKHTDPRSEY
ncbi:MAG: RHS repeat protein [Algicola sp.]|nr:RHS repeat protein [Algicola sp.]